jgi:hypothetical protein
VRGEVLLLSIVTVSSDRRRGGAVNREEAWRRRGEKNVDDGVPARGVVRDVVGD